MGEQFFFKRRPKAINVGPMSIEILYACNPEGWDISQSGDDERTTFTWWERADEHGKAADAVKLREAFEAVATPAGLSDFLKRSGPFRSGATSVTWQNFQKWQDYFRSQRLKVSGFGNQPEHSSHSEFSLRVVQPSITVTAKELPSGDVAITNGIHCESVVDTIAALNLLDRIRRADVRPCARKSCSNLFEKLDKRKIYCSHTCAVIANREERRKPPPKTRRSKAPAKATLATDS